MTSEIVKSILERINRPDLVSVLADDLSGSELNSVLLEVFSLKTKAVTPPQLLNLYQLNRFVTPADLPVIDSKRKELEVLELLDRFSFKAIELSPVSILGSCSVVGPADQKKILSALRGTEVIADSTNSIALHFCDLKQKKVLAADMIRFCTIQRMVRTQAIDIKGFTPHFKAGCLVSFGNDTGAFDFEKTALNEHVRVMQALFIDYYKMDEISFRLLRRTGYPESFLREMGTHLQEQNPRTRVTVVENADKEIEYYKGIQYKADISYEGKTFEIVDGGFVDWTQHLLQNKKERMLSTGFGFDLMLRILGGQL